MPDSYDRFGGKVAIVTGAGSGIGKATAERLAAEGAAVAAFDLNLEAVQATVDDIIGAGGAASAHAVDVSDESSVVAGVAAAVAEHGRPDVVCNIAGIGTFAWTHEMDLELWNRIIGVNLTGTFLMCKATIPHLLDGGGVIVNTASTAGLYGQPWSAAYCGSKGGVVLLTKALAYEYEETALRVNAVAPGGVETPIQKDFYDVPEGGDGKKLFKMMTRKGMCSPDEVAATFAHVASDDARYMNGSIVVIDGGITA
jgi:meso-butanediol dehydrogenase / (S,S)-butanediol dehydrogenase / diacetyl reductase